MEPSDPLLTQFINLAESPDDELDEQHGAVGHGLDAVAREFVDEQRHGHDHGDEFDAVVGQQLVERDVDEPRDDQRDGLDRQPWGDVPAVGLR